MKEFKHPEKVKEFCSEHSYNHHLDLTTYIYYALSYIYHCSSIKAAYVSCISK